MKIIKKILLIILATFIILFIAGYIATLLLAKPLITNQLEKHLGIKAEIGSVVLGLPLNLEINNLYLENLAKIEKIKISPSIIGFLSGRVIINNISLLRPDITIIRERDGTFNFPQSTLEQEKQKGKLLIAGLDIKDGTVSVFDKSLSDKTFAFTIKDINAKIFRAGNLPYPLKIKYSLSALIPSRPQVKQATIKADGLINLTNKDMQGALSAGGIDIVFFKPYFGMFLSSLVASDNATADLSADLSAKNNDLLIECHLVMKNLMSKEQALAEAEEQSEEYSSESLELPLLGLFKNPQGEIVVDFEIRTKLDRPRLNKINLKANIFQNVIENVVRHPETIIDTIKDIGGQLKGEKLKNTLKSIFGTSEE